MELEDVKQKTEWQARYALISIFKLRVRQTQIEWEAQRIAFAFGLEDYGAHPHQPYGSTRIIAMMGDVEIWWDIAEETQSVVLMTVGADEDSGCQVELTSSGWKFVEDQEYDPQYRGIMARALYCLAIQDDEVLEPLNHPLPSYEKLDLHPLDAPRVLA